MFCTRSIVQVAVRATKRTPNNVCDLYIARVKNTEAKLGIEL